MKCMLCGSENLETIDTVVSDFVMARINPNFEQGKIENYKTKLCFCKDCTFAFYEYRLSEEEDQRLYEDYRGEKYQKTREKYDCWYTKEMAESMNSDETRLKDQQRVIESVVFAHTDRDIKVALDYGGNEGKTFTPRLGTEEKYVYDISGVKTVDGVKGISDYDELKNHSFDLIMCNQLFEHLADPIEVLRQIGKIGDKDTLYYIEVPSENPFFEENKFSLIKSLKLLFNPHYSKTRLIRYFFHIRKQPFKPMKEHINFFTEKSIKGMIEREGFKIIDIEENVERYPDRDLKVLSVLFQS